MINIQVYLYSAYSNRNCELQDSTTNHTHKATTKKMCTELGR